MSASIEHSHSDYIILGSGIFGASTALHLIIQSDPGTKVTLIDRDSYLANRRVAASWDWNKVIRSDYSSPHYTKLALEAQHRWRVDPLHSQYYHESGAVWISSSDFSSLALQNFHQTGDQNAVARVRACPVDEFKEKFRLFEKADYTNVKQVLVNERSGWAEAKEALQATIEEAVRLGVKYVTAEISTLAFEEQNDGNKKLRCTGVKTSRGEVFTADRVVLGTGAYTPKLLMDSAPDNADLHAGERILAAGVTEGVEIVQEGSFREGLEEMPVGMNDNPLAGPGEYWYGIGVLPLPKLHALKYWGQIIFRNTTTHPVTGTLLSMPPPGPDYAQWDVPQRLQKDVRSAPASIFGDPARSGLGRNIQEVRICWEATTPDEHFIISPHSACDGLFVATCGSFHGFKFLPVIGKYVVQMLNGKLDPEWQRRWAWDRETVTNVMNKSPPTELRDLKM